MRSVLVVPGRPPLRTCVRRGPLHWLAVWILALAVAAGLAGRETSLPVQLERDAAASIKVTTLSGFTVGAGFLPVLVSIENRAREERTWRLGFTVGGNFEAQLASTFTFTVPPQKTVETAIFVPSALTYWNNNYTPLIVRAEGPGSLPFVDNRIALFTGAYGSVQATFDSGAVAATPGAEAAFRALLPAPGSRTGSARAARTHGDASFAVVAPQDWPADWRTWSLFHLVVTTQEEWETMDRARRDALNDWVALGGQLLIAPNGSSTARPPERHGLGRRVWFSKPLSELAQADLRGDEVFNRRLAELPWMETTDLLLPEDEVRWKPAERAGWPVYFLMLFGVLVGPVNLFVFAPRNRRHRLFVTVPLLSLGATVLLASAILLRDGFGGQGTRRALVVLLPEENKAIVSQEQLARTGVLGRRTFAVPADAYVALDSTRKARTARGETRQLFREGDQAWGDWFSSRTQQRLELQRIVPTRARIELVEGGRDGAPPVLQSSLGVALRDVVYVDAAGREWGASELPVGRRVTLSPRPANPGPRATRQVFGRNVRTNHFYGLGAAGDLAPIDTLRSIEWVDQAVFYCGAVVGGEGTR